jgi:hypothetical protein
LGLYYVWVGGAFLVRLNYEENTKVGKYVGVSVKGK